MKPTRKLSLPPAAGDVEEKLELRDEQQADHLKERQKLPSLPGISPGGNWSLLVPANELEFANFYHL